jgi:hypothetical protein
MNCVLEHQTPPKRFASKPGEILGADFGWGNVTPTEARSMHLAFVASYLSNDPPKDLTADAVRAFHADGIATVDVWESTGTRATEGYSAGEQDADTARSLAKALGNITRPIIFAIDCDCTDSQIALYFEGVHHILGSRDDAYGGYWQVLFLHQQHLVGNENWQTYAWSGGLWLPASIAPLEQYLNGSTYDWDRAIAIPYGEFPWAPPKPAPAPVITHTTTTPTPPVPPPAPKGTVCFGSGATPSSRTCKAIIARHTWLIGRRNYWQREFNRCIRYAEGIGCTRAERWWLERRSQALSLHRRYSR